MLLPFSKYQGTGNDFILIDNRDGVWDQLEISQIRFLCDRRFGIGADGLIKINRTENVDFEVDYYNADGSKSFCGNGARCSVAFAAKLGIDVSKTRFTAIDGEHEAEYDGQQVFLKMQDVHGIRTEGNDFVLNTGSPHYIRFVENALNTNVVAEGRKIRYSPAYQEEGINVNFVEVYQADELEVCTYERGVEDETLSCGTGVTAAALAISYQTGSSGTQRVKIHTKGGKLWVHFDRSGSHFSNIVLQGPAQHVYDGSINI